MAPVATNYAMTTTTNMILVRLDIIDSLHFLLGRGFLRAFLKRVVSVQK
jgi:hypothetical protein